MGQHLVPCVDVRRDAAQRVAAVRAERKEAIMGFLGAAERVEQYLGEQVTEPDRNGARLAELMHEVWLAKKIIELVCSGGLGALPPRPADAVRSEIGGAARIQIRLARATGGMNMCRLSARSAAA